MDTPRVGIPRSAATSRRLACDASRVVMRHGAAGHLLEIGARTRTIPPALRRALRACHDSQGLRLDARTACAGWLGERLDLGWAIDVLHPLAQRARPSPASVHSCTS